MLQIEKKQDTDRLSSPQYSCRRAHTLTHIKRKCPCLMVHLKANISRTSHFGKGNNVIAQMY